MSKPTLTLGQPLAAANPNRCCPHCKSLATASAEVYDPAAKAPLTVPPDGSINVCAYCAEPSVYENHGLSLRLLNEEELADTDLHAQLAPIQAALRNLQLETKIESYE